MVADVPEPGPTEVARTLSFTQLSIHARYGPKPKKTLNLDAWVKVTAGYTGRKAKYRPATYRASLLTRRRPNCGTISHDPFKRFYIYSCLRNIHLGYSPKFL